MRIAIIGAGRIGTTLGRRWTTTGHDVIYGVRDPDDPRWSDLAPATTTALAVDGADVVLIALPWAAVDQALPAIEVGDAVVLDATNPRDALDASSSGAEHVAQLLGSSRVVKAFNTTGSANMANAS